MRLAQDCPNVKTLSGAVVEGLEFGGEGGGKPAERVTGVRLRGGHTLTADLVVDASGRGSKAPEWLQAAGWTPPPTVTVDANLVYTSCMYELAEDWQGENAVMVIAKPPDTRSGMLMPIEGGRHHVRVWGVGGE